MEILLLLIIILILTNNNINGILSFAISVIIIGIAAYLAIWIGALAILVSVIGN